MKKFDQKIPRFVDIFYETAIHINILLKSCKLINYSIEKGNLIYMFY